MKNKLLHLIAVIALAIFIANCKHENVSIPIDPTPQPGPVPNGGVCFETEILPLFQSNCAKSGCHDAATHTEDLVLDSYANIIRKKIVPGNANASDLYEVLFKTGSNKMPPPPNPDLTAAQKALIGKWINEGAKNTVNCGTSCDSTQFKYSANISLIMSTYCTGCHGGTAPSANINLSTYNGVQQQALNGKLIGAITQAAGYSPMPKSASKLSDCKITQVKKWILAGALNN
ncbi:MAG: hypothetical protein IPP48_05830 [Chitinophagaceae bacterium]|nr:hypothetical protein [Chitinophagaceae bacterium]